MSDKTEKPTPRRLLRAQTDGDIAKSAHLSTAMSAALWWLLLAFEAPHTFSGFIHMIDAVSGLDASRSFAWQFKAVLNALLEPGKGALIMLSAGMLANVIPELVQTRGLVSFRRIAPDLKRLNPVEGLKNLFGLKVAFETVLMLFQFAVLIFVAWRVTAEWLVQIEPAYSLDPLSQLALASLSHSRLLALVALSQAAPAVADYAMQHVLRKRRLRMDKEELKREYRDEHGDPYVKGRRRALHRDLNR
ncbi:EscU/YscU/HrcU family type III secretion system export apparatus switch protein [Caballeronia sp. GAWG2-1]|uniref:EscU/YscU/HrcU family type III secretion system export apparatus switch protein n=1 Tax=Caballeronia sp. GAWG2-1 TaxID=2921744 RepID=UPI002027EBCF|nr:EscU/YscU/HrcU family type III secretion system export apparatus switch protein [Caballeronia sp. GAWG2-1]